MDCQKSIKMAPFHDFSLFVIYFLDEDRRGFPQNSIQ